jgi:hypothetical protein
MSETPRRKKGQKQPAKQKVQGNHRPPRDPLTSRYWIGSTFDQRKFFDETFQIQSGPNSDGLYRDLHGQLFIHSYEWDKKADCLLAVHLAAVSYERACAWLIQTGQRRPPEKMLAFHGIRRQAVQEKLTKLGQSRPAWQYRAICEMFAIALVANRTNIAITIENFGEQNDSNTLSEALLLAKDYLISPKRNPRIFNN